MLAMTPRQTIAFVAALALLAGASVGVLHALDASQELALLVVLVIAGVGGTLLGVFGDRTHEDREPASPALRERPHGA